MLELSKLGIFTMQLDLCSYSHHPTRSIAQGGCPEGLWTIVNGLHAKIDMLGPQN